MDAPAMFQRNQVPEDAGLRNNEVEESGGQGQLHREEKDKKPKVLRKVKDKVKKLKSKVAGGSRSSNGHGQGGEHYDAQQQQLRDDRAAYDDNGDSEDEYEEEEEDERDAGAAALQREAATEKGGYMADVEDKNVPMESDPEVHGAPMYESERSPPVQDLVAKFDPERAPAAREAKGADAPGVRSGDLGAPQEAMRERDDSPKVRLGDLSGSAVEDPAAPRSTTPAAREGEDIGSTPVVKEFESMSLSDDKSHVGAAKEGAQAENWKDAAADKLGAGGGGATYTDKLRNVAAVPTEYGRKLASTVYEKVGGGSGKRVDGTAAAGVENPEAMSVSDAAGAGGEEYKDAPADALSDTTTTTNRSSAAAPGYTDKIKSAAGTVYEKVAAVAPVSLRPQAGAGTNKPQSGVGAAAEQTRELGAETEGAAKQAADSTTGSAQSGPGYTDKIKSAAGTVYEKVAAVAPVSLRPQAGAGTNKPQSDVGAAAERTRELGADTEGAAKQAADSTTGTGQSGPGYTDKIKAAAGTVYGKVAGVGTVVASKVPSASGVGTQQKDSTSAPTTGVDQDKGVTATGSVAERLRPGDEHRELSQAIADAVKSVPAPSQVITKAREAVTSLTGGSRVSETAQPEAATGAEVKENISAEAPVLRGEEPEVVEPKMNTNTM